MVGLSSLTTAVKVLFLLLSTSAANEHLAGKLHNAHNHAKIGAHEHKSVAGLANLPTTDFVSPEFFKCFNSVNGAFYFYDTNMLKEYALGKVYSSPVKASKAACGFLPALTKNYKVFEVALQPDIGFMRFAQGINPVSKKQQRVVCDAVSWDFNKPGDDILCTAELAKEVNDPRTQAYIGNINDPRFKHG